jgi:endonuclease YncB( thermonuclease family)
MPGMSPKLRRLVCASLACVLAATAGRAQKTSDSCGSPMIESQGWSQLDGHVSKVIDGRTLQVIVPVSVWADPQGRGGTTTLRVHIAGIALDRRKQFSKEAKKRVQELLLNKTVQVLVTPGLDEPPKQVTAVVLGKGGDSDVALSLLEEGLVRFKRPPAYASSAYNICQYRRAEAAARSKKLGMLQ